MRRPLLAVLAAMVAAGPVAAQTHRESVRDPGRAAAAGGVPRNPAFLRATQILGRREPGEAPRVRFQWERVPGATEYLLRGSWTDKGWALRSTEYRVTSESATTWGAETVTFEVSLLAGEHSWAVVALTGDPTAGDFAAPARLSFRLD